MAILLLQPCFYLAVSWLSPGWVLYLNKNCWLYSVVWIWCIIEHQRNGKELRIANSGNLHFILPIYSRYLTGMIFLCEHSKKKTEKVCAQNKSLCAPVFNRILQKMIEEFHPMVTTNHSSQIILITRKATRPTLRRTVFKNFLVTFYVTRK